jgi:MraZ protein
MLIGNFSAKLSPNGRTAIPKKFRQELGDHVIVTQGYEQCLIIVSTNSWSKLINPDKPFILDAARETDRFLLGNAFEADLDDQGRLVIPQILKNYAQLTDHLIFVGVGNRVEIWSQSRWVEYQEYLNKNSGDIAKRLIEKQIT